MNVRHVHDDDDDDDDGDDDIRIWHLLDLNLQCLWTEGEGNFEIRTSSQVPQGLPGFEPSFFWLEGCAKYQELEKFAEALNAVCRQ